MRLRRVALVCNTRVDLDLKQIGGNLRDKVQLK